MNTIKAEEMDRIFDEGKDISAWIDTSRAQRPNLVQKNITLDLPLWMIEQLDLEARKLGVAREAIMKMMLAQQLRKPG